VIDWQRVHGRHDLPWQRTRDAYRIWLSEIMLQQTQVSAVIPYYRRFLDALPDVQALARADIDQVLGLWSGLGYYSRARNLHAAARQVVDRHGGHFPPDAATLATLPGVGRSTAAAIAVFAFGERAAILDGNVKRVFSRVFAIDGDPQSLATTARLWRHAEAELPAPPASSETLIAWTQGLMDLGATCCTRSRPACERCPLADVCIARQTDAVDRYPAARARRTVPLREADLLFVQSAGQVLLQWRPPTGIWGGLQSLPEPLAQSGVSPAPVRVQANAAAKAQAKALPLPLPFPDAQPVPAGPAMLAAIARWLAMVGLVSREPAWPMARIDHAFTHFRLRATIWRVDVEPDAQGVPPDGAGLQSVAAEWRSLASISDAPLPGPIKQFLHDKAR
jgi:A/G-specific adenine glycosylase